MSRKVETRSDKKKSGGEGESSAVPPAQSGSERHGPAPRSLVDGYGPQELLDSPPDCFPSSLKEEQLDVISRSFGIDRALMLLPGPGVMPYSPPEGYFAYSRYHCMCGAIPPLNAWVVSFLTYLKVAPFQLQPNSYAILVSLFVIFRRKYGRAPSNREIRYLYNLRGYKKGSPYVSLESAVTFKPVLDLYSKFSMFKKEWFFVRDDSVSIRRFTSGCKLMLLLIISILIAMLLLILSHFC